MRWHRAAGHYGYVLPTAASRFKTIELASYGNWGEKPLMSTAIKWLHLSDFHFCLDQRYDANIVLAALLHRLSSLAGEEFLPVDLIFVTGDIAHSGSQEEYRLAASFFDKLVTELGVTKDKIYVVPGNHDVDRNRVRIAAAIDAYMNDPGLTPVEIRARVAKLWSDKEGRELVLRRLGSYSEFVNGYFAGHLSFDTEGFFYSRTVQMGEANLTIYGLNSAWLCSSDSDRNRLLIGERQVRDVIGQGSGSALRVALVHHPFDWLADSDRSDSEDLLIQNCDFILHGHRHKQAFRQEKRPSGQPYIFASGPGYDSRSLPNACNLVRIDLGTGSGSALSLHYSDKGGGFWARDTQSDPGLHMGIYRFDLGHPYAPEMPAGAPVPEVKALVSSPSDYAQYIERTGQLYAVTPDDLLEIATLSPMDAIALLNWLASQSPAFAKDLIAKTGGRLGQALSRSPADLNCFVDLRDQLMHTSGIPNGTRQKKPTLLVLGAPGGQMSSQVVLQIPRKDPSQPRRAEQLVFSICLTGHSSESVLDPKITLSASAPFLSYPYRGGGFIVEPLEYWRISKPDAKTVRCLFCLPQGIARNILGSKNPVIGTVRMLIPWGEADNRPIDLDFAYEIECDNSWTVPGAFKIKIVPALTQEMAAEAKQFVVPANRKEGIDTTLFVQKGQMLRFAADGVVSLDSGNHFVNADGYTCDEHGRLYQPALGFLGQYESPGELLKGQRAGVLLGWLGDWRDGQGFYVGSTNTIVTESEGSLHLAVNDLLHAYGDNSGAFTVLVRVE